MYIMHRQPCQCSIPLTIMKPSHFQQKIYETSSNVVWDSSVLWHTSYEIKVYNLIINS